MSTLLDPAILFFVFGVVAGLLRSNLEVPAAVAKFLSLYLLMALGLKGGFALAGSGLTADVATSLGVAVLLALIVPIAGYLVLRRFLSGFDAAAVAATYGSVSAVTFVTAVQYLEGQQVAYGGHMAAAMALMESPAIVLAVILANALRQASAGPAGAVSSGSGSATSAGSSAFSSSAIELSGGGAAALPPAASPKAGVPLGKVLHESLTDGAQLLLLGAMLVGLLSGDAGKAAMQPFSADLFKGMLSLFLLDMGLMTARNLPQLKGRSPWLIGYAIVGPACHASLALALAWVFGVPAGDGALLMVLAASASYIAVPAALRFAIPEASPTLYFGLSLGVTFPLNILFGIPACAAVAARVLG